jgi:pimeloyl-ACP methyl ester carboxylesterase
VTTFAQGTVAANGLEFHYLEAGEGPLVLLLHGFPDNAHTWSHQLAALAEAGFHGVAPFMRGYPPTDIPVDGRYDLEALAADIAGLVEALGDGPAYVAGHDWGGIATTAAMAYRPDHLRAAAVMATNHPVRFLSFTEHPEQVQHAFHFWFFQVNGWADAAVRHNDLALVDHLWSFWSPSLTDPDHIAQVKATLRVPGAVEAALGYYRAFIATSYDPPEPEKLFGPYSVPTLSIWGSDDPPLAIAIGEEDHFTGGYQRALIEGAGHFAHREAPSEVSRLLVDWFASCEARSEAALT